MKKLLLVPVTAALALGLVACGATETASESKPAETSTTTESAAPAGTTQAAESDTSAEETEASAKDVAPETVEIHATAEGKGTLSWGVGGSLNTEEFEGEITKTVELTDEFDIVTGTVTGDFMKDTNNVSCQILAGGEVEDEATGLGQGAMASCTFTEGL